MWKSYLFEDRVGSRHPALNRRRGDHIMDARTNAVVRRSLLRKPVRLGFLSGSIMAVLAAISLFAVSVLPGVAQATPGTGFTRVVNGTATLEPVDLRTRDFKLRLNNQTDAIMAQFTLEPGGNTGWHSHPGPVLVTVAQGSFEITRYTKEHGCTDDVYGPGEGFIGPANVVHLGRNVSDKKDKKVVGYVTFLNVPVGGAPLDASHEAPDCGR